MASGSDIVERGIDLRQLQTLAPGAIICSRLTAEELEELNSRTRVFPDPLPRSSANKRLLEAWADFLSPHFADGEACNLTGTYSDDYGYSHGLMLTRNVIADFQRFRRKLGRGSSPACIGVEYHPTTHRAILHFHAMLGGSWSDSDLRSAQAEWVISRGWCHAKRVEGRAGCVEYAAKHLLKQGDADSFDFMLPPERFGSRTERRFAKQGRL
jgi:hypothetical protein